MFAGFCGCLNAQCLRLENRSSHSISLLLLHSIMNHFFLIYLIVQGVTGEKIHGYSDSPKSINDKRMINICIARTLSATVASFHCHPWPLLKVELHSFIADCTLNNFHVLAALLCDSRDGFEIDIRSSC